jgi:hypothetical protein
VEDAIMNLGRRLVVLVLLAGLGAVFARAQDSPAPAWKLDAPFAQKWVTHVEQVITITDPTESAGKVPTKSNQDLTLTVLWTPVNEARKAPAPADDKPKQEDKDKGKDKTGDKDKATDKDKGKTGDKDKAGAEDKDKGKSGDKDKAGEKDKGADKDKTGDKDKAKAGDKDKTPDQTKDDGKRGAAPGTEQVLTLKVQDVQFKGALGDEKVEIDLSKPADAGNALDAALRKLKGAEFTVKLAVPSMKVLEIKGADKVFADLPAAQQAVVGAFFSEAALRRQVEAAFPPLPAKKGETEKRSDSLKVEPLGGYAFDTAYTSEGTEGKQLSLKVKADVKYTPPEAKGPFAVKEEKAGPVTAEGTVVFDTEKGLLGRSTLEFKEKLRTFLVTIGKTESKAIVAQTYSLTIEAAGK